MRRRAFLKGSIQAGAIGSLTPLALANPTPQEFAAAQARFPWLRALANVEQDAYDTTVAVHGKWPAGLHGTLYRNGPARHEIGDFRYQHWFSGDGMVHAYRLSGDGLHHRARMVQTFKYQAERKAGRALYPGFASTPPDPAPVSSADAVNVANISVLHHHGELFALWEAGSPWRMDAATLDTLGVHAFSDDTAGAPFSAHPRVDPDGTLWNFGYVSSAGVIALWHIDANGQVVKVGTVPSDPMTMPHDFIVTSRHIVILLPPLHYRGADLGNAGGFVSAHQWSPQDPTRVLVVSKDDFSQTQWYELPAQWVFHFGNGWEDEQGVIRFDGASADDPGIMTDNFVAYMHGRPAPARSTRHLRFRIDTKRGKASQSELIDTAYNTEFPVIDPRVSGMRNSRLVLLAAGKDDPAEHPMLTSVCLYDDRRETLERYRYPATVIPEEHLYIGDPQRGPEQGGWIVGTALDFANGRTELNVFDAEHLADGPVARAELPYALPLGLHGKFVT